MRMQKLGTLAAGLVLVCAMVFAGRAQGQLPGVEPLKDSGQDVTPSFEGWYQNADGTYNLSFGYHNRNLKEEVDIPIGPNNRVEPGGPDQGQPTHFYPRRQMGLFTVTVPKDFGSKRVTWTLVRNGKTNTVPAHIDPRWEIDALEDTTIGNKSPFIRFSPTGPQHSGPRNLMNAITASTGQPATLDVYASDDGVTLRREPNPKAEPVLTVHWTKYRGPGKVIFAKGSPEVDRASGKATTTATFTEPGEYLLRITANDYTGPTGASGQCCWTNGLVKVTVSGAGTK